LESREREGSLPERGKKKEEGGEDKLTRSPLQKKAVPPPTQKKGKKTSPRREPSYTGVSRGPEGVCFLRVHGREVWRKNSVETNAEGEGRSNFFFPPPEKGQRKKSIVFFWGGEGKLQPFQKVNARGEEKGAIRKERKRSQNLSRHGEANRIFEEGERNDEGKLSRKSDRMTEGTPWKGDRGSKEKKKFIEGNLPGG